MDAIYTYINDTSIFYNIIIAITLTTILSIALRLTLRYLTHKASKTKNTLDDVVIKSISMPILVFIWFLLIYYIIGLVASEFSSLNKLEQPLQAAPIIIITWFIFRFINNIELMISASKSKLNSDSTRLITRIIKIFILLLTTLTIAQFFGLSVTSILTFGGMGGIIIGFAAKDLLANIFGGLMLQIDKPFNTGDWIRSSEHNFEGTVNKIGWRMTKVITFSKNPIYIPNSIFATIPIETPSRMTNRRIKETIGVRYDDIDKISIILAQIKQYLIASADIDKRQALIINLNEFNAYSVDFFVYAFTKTKNWQKYHQIKQDVLLEISNIITKNNAEIAFPTQVNHLINSEVLNK